MPVSKQPWLGLSVPDSQFLIDQKWILNLISINSVMNKVDQCIFIVNLYFFFSKLPLFVFSLDRSF